MSWLRSWKIYGRSLGEWTSRAGAVALDIMPLLVGLPILAILSVWLLISLLIEAAQEKFRRGYMRGIPKPTESDRTGHLRTSTPDKTGQGGRDKIG